MRSTAAASGAPELPTTPQIPHMLSDQGYAVVSCHVERPLDDRVWAAYLRLLLDRPGGFRVASLVRPPADGEDERLWLERARRLAELGPFGHHTHWTGPSHARPTSGRTGEKVRREGLRLRELGLAPTLFCGGGWYFDAEVAAAVAELGYRDCTGTSFRPAYLAEGAPRLAAPEPVHVRVDGLRFLELPTTHSIGAGVRAVVRGARGSRHLHLYFHDTDLLDRRRALALRATLRLLSRLRRPTDLDALAGAVEQGAPERPLEELRG